MHKKIYAAVLGIFTLSLISFVGAQTQPSNSDDVLERMSENLRNTRTMKVSGTVDTTLNTNSLKNNLIFRMLAPRDWLEINRQVGFKFEGMMNFDNGEFEILPSATSTSGSGNMSMWNLDPYSTRINATSTPIIGTSTDRINIITEEDILYINAERIINILEERGLLASTSTTSTPNQDSDWISFDDQFITRIDDLLGGGEMSGLIEEKKEMLHRISEDPKRMFRVTGFRNETVNGKSVFRIDFRGTERLLNEMYPVTNRGAVKNASGSLWVERETFMPVRMNFTSRLQEQGQTKDRFNLSVNVDEVNGETNIVIPTIVRNAQRMFHDVFHNLAVFFLEGLTTTTPGSVTTTPTPTTTPTTTPTPTPTSTTSTSPGGQTTSTPTTTPTPTTSPTSSSGLSLPY